MFAKFSFFKYSIIYNLMGYHTTQFSLKQNKTKHHMIQFASMKNANFHKTGIAKLFEIAPPPLPH